MRELCIRFLSLSLWASLLLGIGACFGWQEQPPGKASLDGAIDVAARDLAAAIAKSDRIKTGSTLAIGTVAAPVSNNGGGGAEIQQAIHRALDALPGKPFKFDNRKYDVQLRGEYFNTEIPGTPPLPAARVRLTATDTKGDTLGTFETTILGVEAVPRLRGISVVIPRAADDNLRAEKINEATENPAPAPEGNEVKPAPQSDFSLELLVKGENGQFVAATPSLVKGQVFAEIPKGKEYHIVIKNNSKDEVAVALSIDGLNVFHFSQIQPAPKYWIVAPGGQTRVTGWFGTETKANAFLSVEDFSKTARAVAGLQLSDEVGLIHAAVCSSSETEFKGSRGTAIGGEVATNIEKVKRFIGNPIAHISVRYERK